MQKILLSTILVALACAQTDMNDFKNNCMACVSNNYFYCEKSGNCMEAVNGTCPKKSQVFDSSTFCPTIGHCDFGVSGIGHLGDKVSPTGLGNNGNSKFNVTTEGPCYIQLINTPRRKY